MVLFLSIAATVGGVMDEVAKALPYVRWTWAAVDRGAPRSTSEPTSTSSNAEKEKVRKFFKFRQKIIEEKSDSESDNETTSGVSKASTLSSDLDLPLRKEPLNEDDAECLFCFRKFSEDRKGELWVQCITCGSWSHVDCAGVEKDIWICDFCRQ
ncbi:hypothetical protein FQA39_LY07225 [Lamprigera yunnana]|nr:hypothetical protein FQA39_LY07225 [Lamprigera yunnana]